MIVNLLLLSLAIFIFLGLIPLKYLKGKFYKCVSFGDAVITTKWDCFDYGGDWVNSDFPYDNIKCEIKIFY